MTNQGPPGARPPVAAREPLATAVRLLAASDRTRETLTRGLARRGIDADAAAEAVDVLERAGYVDDRRYAARRAETLARRGAGDALILDDLRGHGVADEDARVAVAGIEPEPARMARIVAARGCSARTLRLLAAKGFTEESLEALVAELDDGAVG